MARFNAKNPGRKAELTRASDQRDRQRVQARDKRWRDKNPDHARALANARTKRYYQRKKDEGL